MPSLVLPLSDPEVTLASAGGKGANLQRLLQAGLPVPPGVVVTTAAYRDFVAANALAPRITALSGAARPDDPGSFEAASAEIRSLFAAGQMPRPVASAIMAAYAALGTPAVAVRSSATAEDLPEASFAGQQETYLNVRGEARLIEAVQRCWSSLWTARAMAYRARQGLAPDAVALAVVVQCLVPARAAGVLFTVNPVTGAGGEMVVNATWGLGEALVAGQGR
jgi:pyruvate,water dikinase